MKTFRTVITHNLHLITIIIISRFSFVIFTLFDLAQFKTFEMQIVRFCKFLLTCCFYIITIPAAVLSSCKLYMISLFLYLALIAISTCLSAHLFCRLHVAHRRNSAETRKKTFSWEYDIITIETNEKFGPQTFVLCKSITYFKFTSLSFKHKWRYEAR